jgi:hypothetical protein
MTPPINTLFPVDLFNPLAREHRLNVGRTMWLLAIPEWSGGLFFQDLASGFQSTTGVNTRVCGIINLFGGAGDGWRNDYRPGGGRSVALDGTVNDYIQLHDGFGNSNLSTLMSASAGTIAAWVRVTMTAASGGNAYALPNILGDGANNFWGLHVGTISGTTGIWAYAWDGAEKRVSGPYTQNAWTRAVWVHAGGNLLLYLNGVPAGSVAAGAVSTTNLAATLGDPSTGHFSGQVDDVACWNRGLSAAEVLDDYLEGIAGYPGVLNRVTPLGSFSLQPGAPSAGGPVIGSRVVQGVAQAGMIKGAA